jgi:PKD repeat protein
MKYLLVFTYVIGMLCQLSAQERCQPTNATNNQIVVLDKSQIADFTITDTQGNVLNLYATLNEGKTVFLDLFFTTCSYCIQYAPIIEQVYELTGSGQGDVLFWGISPQDNNAQIDAYKLAHNISNPCAGTEGGGPQAIDIINTGQNFLGYPTYIIVCPDKNMQYDVCYPPTVNCMLGKIENCANILFPKWATAEDTVYTTHPVQFADSSTGQPTAWLWEFEGATPASSTDQNPIVIYETEGVYDVKLTVTNANGSQTVTKTDYITVLLNVGQPELEGQGMKLVKESNALSVHFNEPIIGSVSLINISGQTVYTSNSNHSASITIPTSQLSKGIYVIRVLANNKSLVAKVLIN